MKVLCTVTINEQRIRGYFIVRGENAFIEYLDGKPINWSEITDIDTKTAVHIAKRSKMGQAKSEKKAASSRENGKLGGRPKKIRVYD